MGIMHEYAQTRWRFRATAEKVHLSRNFEETWVALGREYISTQNFHFDLMQIRAFQRFIEQGLSSSVSCWLYFHHCVI